MKDRHSMRDPRGISACIMKLGGLLLATTVMLPVLCACSPPGNDYAEYVNLPSQGWKYGDTIFFTPVHYDSICRGRLVVGVRHRNDFPYTSLWLETTVEDDGHRVTDTMEIVLADSFGSWTGRGIGASFQKADTIAGTFRHVSGSRVAVRHIMRADTLRGITQAGIFFVPEE